MKIRLILMSQYRTCAIFQRIPFFKQGIQFSSIQFSSIQFNSKNFNHSTKGNFVVAMADTITNDERNGTCDMTCDTSSGNNNNTDYKNSYNKKRNSETYITHTETRAREADVDLGRVSNCVKRSDEKRRLIQKRKEDFMERASRI